jgi:hypothetical protein
MVASVDEVLRDEWIDATSREVDQPLIEAICKRLPERKRRGRVWPGGATFRGTTFKGDVSFSDALFAGSSGPTFSGATFEGEAEFSGAKFEGPGSFLGTRFQEDVSFADSRFDENAYFSKALFGGSAFFEGARVTGTLAFERARFADTRLLGPLIGLKEVLLWDASFAEPVEISVASRSLDATGLELEKGGTLRVRWADVDIANAHFAEPSLLTGAAALPLPRWRGGVLDEDELRSVLGVDDQEDADGRPRLMSLRNANATNLVVGAVDLRHCVFADARNLELIRLLPDAALAQTPGWSGVKRGERLPGWMWTNRQVIADEYLYRLEGLDDEERERLMKVLAGSEPEPPEGYAGLEAARHRRRAQPAEIAGLYRQLRMAREESKDAPGAGDFYYGESEMRRHAPGTPTGERIVLWLYWLVSGYGLRVTRALAGLALTIVLFAALLWWIGFDPRPSFVRSLLFSAASTSSLFRVPKLPGTELTDVGELLQIFLRVLGPLFFGLAILSIRARVKR